MAPEKIGITTTIPIEVIYASGNIPVDINNIFITGEHPEEDLSCAESNGFPHSFCAWVKGLYGTIHRTKIKHIVGVTTGDCSDSHALCELIENEGIRVTPFAYPLEPDAKLMKEEINKLCVAFKINIEQAEKEKSRLDEIRVIIHEIDKLAYEKNCVTGTELFNILINASDFKGNPDLYLKEAENLLTETKRRKPFENAPRIGVCGLPPVFSDFTETVESLGARVLFHEIPMQFSLPFEGENIVESYTKYTYPYPPKYRIADIKKQIEKRNLNGIIHYVQSFCHRQVYDRLLREQLNIPILTIEGDRPGRVDGRTLTRIEAFIETLYGI
jgi:benzoyl-CoA reductase/2-hydroxyglutaryl-CoA dehydratase subunit BcrC/BadD/HgdB